MSDPRTPAQSAPEAERPTGDGAPTFETMIENELIDFLERVGQGVTSGSFTEWPQLRPACRYAAKQLRALAVRTRAAEEELERVRGRLWYCASCRDWKPTILQAGDMVCACGYIVASYHDRAGSQGEEPSKPLHDLPIMQSKPENPLPDHFVDPRDMVGGEGEERT